MQSREIQTPKRKLEEDSLFISNILLKFNKKFKREGSLHESTTL